MYKRRNRAAKERETEREKMCFLFVADLHLSVEMYKWRNRVTKKASRPLSCTPSSANEPRIIGLICSK